MTLDAQTDQLKTLQKLGDEHAGQLAKLSRGVYGDPDNGVRGLIPDVAWIKKWITAANLKSAKIAGAVVVIGLLLKAGWDWIISLRGK